MIDVHMLTLPTDREDWKQQALAALPSWVTLHVVPAQIGPIGPQRYAAYQLGSHPYVSAIDPDDWTEPDTFDRLLKAMLENESWSGVCCREQVHVLDAAGNERGTYLFPEKHKTWVLKREFVWNREALYRFDMHDKDIIATPEVHWVDFVGHHWRRYMSPGKRQRMAKQA